MCPSARGGDRRVRGCHPAADPASGRCRDHRARRAERAQPDVLGRQIIQMITAEGQRQQRASTRMQESIQRLRKALQLGFAGIDEDIDEPVRGSPAWRHDEELTVSVPGVGPASSRTLIAEQPDLGTLDRRQVAALVGLAPFTRRSGKWRGKECIGGGRAIPRAVLFKGGDGRRPAQAAPQRLPRASAAGKPRMMALIAVARKLLTTLKAVVRDKNRGPPLDSQDSRSARPTGTLGPRQPCELAPRPRHREPQTPRSGVAGTSGPDDERRCPALADT